MTDYGALKTQILNEVKKNKALTAELIKINKLANQKKLTYNDVRKFSSDFGRLVGTLLQKNVSDVPANELLEFASHALSPLCQNVQNTTINMCDKVQSIFLDNANIGLKPIHIKNDSSRINHIIERFQGATDFSEVSFLLSPDVLENIANGAVTDSMKANAEFMDSAGMETYVTRSDGAGCCEWCDSMCGTFAIHDIPDDFWRVHKGCSCEFEYHSRSTHSKITFSTTTSGTMQKNISSI